MVKRKEILIWASMVAGITPITSWGVFCSGLFSGTMCWSGPGASNVYDPSF